MACTAFAQLAWPTQRAALAYTTSSPPSPQSLLSLCKSFFLLSSSLLLRWFGHHYQRALLQVLQEQKLVTVIKQKTCCGHLCHGLLSPPSLGNCVEVLQPLHDTYDAETAGEWTILPSKTMV